MMVSEVQTRNVDVHASSSPSWKAPIKEKKWAISVERVTHTETQHTSKMIEGPEPFHMVEKTQQTAAVYGYQANKIASKTPIILSKRAHQKKKLKKENKKGGLTPSLKRRRRKSAWCIAAESIQKRELKASEQAKVGCGRGQGLSKHSHVRSGSAKEKELSGKKNEKNASHV